MKAVCSSNIGINKLELKDIKQPLVTADHILVKVSACGINHGDIAWISGVIPRGASPESLDDVAGVSGAGNVLEIGKNVPSYFQNSKVAFYRALHPSSSKVGTWSEYALLHYLDCVLLPNSENPLEYCGSVVNAITAYAFMKDVNLDSQRGVIITAGTSATGLALLGITQVKNIPAISIVRNESGKQRLKELGAQHVLSQSDDDFEEQLKESSEKLGTNAVFDGIGGEMLTKIIPSLPFGSKIYNYGFLAELNHEALSESKMINVNTMLFLSKNLTLTCFAGFTSKTVKSPKELSNAMNDMKDFIHLPNFKTRIGRTFLLENYTEALQYSLSEGNAGKAVIAFE